MVTVPSKPGYLSGLSFDDFVDAIHEIENDGPRGAVLLGHALLENLMRRVLRSRMVELSKDEEDRLFGGIGPLGSMAARVRVAYAFGLIGREAVVHLNKMRELRNLFAHTGRKIGFDDPEVISICRAIFSDQGEFEPRQIYIGALKALIIHLAETISPEATP